MLYLYAVLEAPPPPLALPAGIGGAPPLFVTAHGLACAASETAAAAIAPEPAQVRRHQAVIEALMADRPVLPLRFGTLAADAAACGRLLEHRRDALRAGLDRVRGRVEFALRVSGLPEPVEDPHALPGAGPGAAYLRALARRARGWPPSTAGFPHDRLATRAAERLLWPRPAGEPDLRASFLVATADVAAFLAEVAALRRLRPDLGIGVTGPWPPYSFADPDLPGDRP